MFRFAFYFIRVYHVGSGLRSDQTHGWHKGFIFWSNLVDRGLCYKRFEAVSLQKRMKLCDWLVMSAWVTSGYQLLPSTEEDPARIPQMKNLENVSDLRSDRKALAQPVSWYLDSTQVLSLFYNWIPLGSVAINWTYRLLKSWLSWYLRVNPLFYSFKDRQGITYNSVNPLSTHP